MGMRSVLLASVFAATLSACTTSTGVTKLGPDTYMLSTQAAPAAGGAGGARANAIREANAYCASMGREVIVTNHGTGRGFASLGAADVTFRCLASGDPDLHRPTYSKEADVVIEDRRTK
jgi:hypothetical protein